MNQQLDRCQWCLGNDLYIDYHDREWGEPLHDDIKLFELLSLEGAQAGLSWLTILKRREGYRRAFNNFDPKIVAKFDDKKFNELINNTDIIRNRLKIRSVINNAKQFINVQKEFGSFNQYLWEFVNHKPIQSSVKEMSDIPTLNEIAVSMSKDLKKKSFNFIGPLSCYAFMQSCGMVNDHLVSCFRFKQLNV